MFIEDGRMFEECDQCSKRVEVGSTYVASVWLKRHIAEFHPDVEDRR